MKSASPGHIENREVNPVDQQLIRDLEREKDSLLDQWVWADGAERVKILIRRMELQERLEDLRQSAGG